MQGTNLFWIGGGSSRTQSVLGGRWGYVLKNAVHIGWEVEVLWEATGADLCSKNMLQAQLHTLGTTHTRHSVSESRIVGVSQIPLRKLVGGGGSLSCLLAQHAYGARLMVEIT
jgi:hypothetical protein